MTGTRATSYLVVGDQQLVDQRIKYSIRSDVINCVASVIHCLTSRQPMALLSALSMAVRKPGVVGESLLNRFVKASSRVS